jgi:predicted O-methyltransferase YrrM
MIRPKVVLEIGTYTGYSAICFAEGLAEGGKLITIDINEELEDRVRGYFKEAGLENVVDYRIGDAKSIIPTINEELDLVFIDADKAGYATYYELCINKVRRGGFIIADNVLWSGKVTQPENAGKDKDLANMLAFNKMVHNDPRVDNLLLPVRDGLMIAVKK